MEREFGVRSSLQLLRWIGWAQRKAADDWIHERGITFEQGFVLGYLEEEPGAIQKDIARMTRTTPASVSSILQGLERRGLIERRTEGGDERSKRVYATEAGLELIAGFEDAMVAADESILSPLTEAERDQLETLLKKVTASLPQPERP